MEALADATGSVLSAVLFGALAGSAALPFPRMAFEAAIRRGQVGVERSLAAFGAGFEAAQSGGAAVAPAASLGHGTRAAPRAGRDLLAAAARDFTGDARAIVPVAIERLVAYRGKSYGRPVLARPPPLPDIA